MFTRNTKRALRTLALFERPAVIILNSHRYLPLVSLTDMHLTHLLSTGPCRMEVFHVQRTLPIQESEFRRRPSRKVDRVRKQQRRRGKGSTALTVASPRSRARSCLHKSFYPVVKNRELGVVHDTRSIRHPGAIVPPLDKYRRPSRRTPHLVS